MQVFRRTDILIPKNMDLSKWAVIACDQFTSDAAYWKRVRQNGAGGPCAVNVFLPEADLDTDHAAAVERIHKTMDDYLKQDVFAIYPESYVYIERTLQNGSVRRGLLGAVDLEAYDYHPGSDSPIRATEETVLERIPPRKASREGASLEFSHVLMLCDDDEQVLIEPLAQQKDQMQMIYDFDLMEQGGHITGWLVDDETARAFEARLQRYTATYEQKYTGMDQPKVLFAVGDGNHSLATAKSCYEDMKAANPDTDFSAHPARYALVELGNIHAPELQFEPIHRVVAQVDAQKLLADIRSICTADGYEIRYVMANEEGTLRLDRTLGEIPVGVLQNFLDDWLLNNEGKVDYIHDDEAVKELAKQENFLGFLLPGMEKHQLFRGVISDGVLPRKTFSMGHAREKRYYLEGRRIK